MSVLTAIFQALGQALFWIFPLSESGHSAIFHDFSGRYTNACSQLTGVIHIGIAIGLAVAFYKLFINLFSNFTGTFKDIFGKRLDLRNSSTSRMFMYMTLISFAFDLFYLIPVGSKGNIYHILHSVSYNGNLLGEGLFFILSAVLLYVAIAFSDKFTKKLPEVLSAVIIGLYGFFALPISGMIYMTGIICVAIILGLQQKNAIRYAVAMSVPTLVCLGIIELCVAVTKVSIVGAILGVIISAVASFFLSKVLIRLIKDKTIIPFAVYDAAVGLICVVIGVFEILSQR